MPELRRPGSGARMFTLGLDYGTNSVRALIVRCSDGAEYGAWVVDYPCGAQGVCSIRKMAIWPGSTPATISSASRRASTARSRKPRRKPGFRRGRRSSASASTPRDRARSRSTRNNRPLALDARSGQDDLAAQCWLWKDHTGWREAARITELAAEMPPAIHRQVRRHLFLGMVLVEDLALPERRARGVRGRLFLGRTRRLDSLGARRRRRIPRRSSAASAPRATRRSTPTNGAACPTRSSCALLDPRLAALRDRLYEKAHDASDAGRVALRRMGGAARASRRHSDRHRRIRRPLRRDRLRRRARARSSR